MTDEFVNTGIRVLNESPCPTQATIVALGLGRSGTTMVAGIIEGLGIFLGDQLNPFKEDRVLQGSIKRGLMDRFQQVCSERDKVHDKWALKSPKLIGDIEKYCSAMRNPRVILIFRDILSISIRNEMVVSSSLIRGLRKSISAYSQVVEQVAKMKTPILMLSYEKALQFPDETVRAIAQFCDVYAGDEVIARAARRIENGERSYLVASAKTAEQLEKQRLELVPAPST